MGDAAHHATEEDMHDYGHMYADEDDTDAQSDEHKEEESTIRSHVLHQFGIPTRNYIEIDVPAYPFMGSFHNCVMAVGIDLHLYRNGYFRQPPGFRVPDSEEQLRQATEYRSAKVKPTAWPIGLVVVVFFSKTASAPVHKSAP